MDRIVEEVVSFGERGLATLGILCKTPMQAERMHDAIVWQGQDAPLGAARSYRDAVRASREEKMATTQVGGATMRRLHAG